MLDAVEDFPDLILYSYPNILNSDCIIPPKKGKSTMKKHGLWIMLFMIPVLISACSLREAGSPDDLDDLISEEEMDAYAAEMISGGFEFCPDTYLEISVVQIHENAQFNFYSEVSSSGELELEIYGTNQPVGLRTKSQLPLTGEGHAGVCQFTSSGAMDLDIIGRLIPGENYQTNILFFTQCETEIKSKPPCGDFGMIPLEMKHYIIIPYQDGGSYEWEWENRNVGVSGSSKWTLHLPCEK
jgi:hypothetical protein